MISMHIYRHLDLVAGFRLTNGKFWVFCGNCLGVKNSVKCHINIVTVWYNGTTLSNNCTFSKIKPFNMGELMYCAK